MVEEHEGYVTEDAYIVGVHRHTFRPGEPAKIVRTVMISPDGSEPRPAFLVVYPDGATDYIVIDFLTMRIVSERDVEAGNLPAVNW